jgi:hypothetical protein
MDEPVNADDTVTQEVLGMLYEHLRVGGFATEASRSRVWWAVTSLTDPSQADALIEQADAAFARLTLASDESSGLGVEPSV